MHARLLYAFGLMALCVAIHAVGLTAAFRWLSRSAGVPRTAPRWTLLLIGITAWTILVHLVEITVWALFYVWKNSIPDLESAVYFSAITYTTTGYGDVVLPREWRLMSGVEALTGILMCGWSTGFFVAVVNHVHLSTRAARQGS